MNFVQLVEDLRIECAVSGAPISSVQTLNGELLRLKTWIRDAWQELQLERIDWKFMRHAISFRTLPGQQTYTLAQVSLQNPTCDIDAYKQDAFTIDTFDDYDNTQEQTLGVMDYADFRRQYVTAYPISDPDRWQRPLIMAIDDARNILLGPPPDDTYFVRGECWMNPQVLTADTDVPIMPVKYHKVIVYRAMKKYAGYESANDVRVRAIQEGNGPETTLFNEQLPGVIIDGGFEGYGRY